MTGQIKHDWKLNITGHTIQDLKHNPWDTQHDWKHNTRLDI